MTIQVEMWVISILRDARSDCEPKDKHELRGRLRPDLFGGNRRKWARWWWARAGWKVVGGHVGLVVGKSGHCNVVDVRLGSEYGGGRVEALVDE